MRISAARTAIDVAPGAALSSGLPAAEARTRARLSPKRPSVERSGLADVFPYYAGFSYDWAFDKISTLDLPSDARILDPWNGSGTTTLAAQNCGYSAIGIDLNPVANFVATLRIAAHQDDLIVISSDSIAIDTRITEGDPLLAWFDTFTVRWIRSWTTYLKQLSLRRSSLAYIALFRVLREKTKAFEGSNPTWVKRAKSSDDLVSISRQDLDRLVVAEQEKIASRCEATIPNSARVGLVQANSGNLPIPDASIHSILTSPPYLTRIDYAVAYARELALLGVDIAQDRALRESLMGTTLIRKNVSLNVGLGPLAHKTLEAIEGHSSKASQGYYRKQAVQYFNDLIFSLDEMTRVVKRGGRLLLVVQDSYYKDIPVRLADIYTEEAELRSWVLKNRDSQPVRRTLTSLNKAAKKYSKAEVSETIVELEKK